MAPYKGTKVVTYHRSFPNFAERFGLDIIGYVEPRPGIPPTPQHTLDLINEMKRQNVKIVMVEPYFDLKTPNAIGRETGAQVLVMPPSVGGVKEVTDYFKLFDYDINLLVDAIKKTRGEVDAWTRRCSRSWRRPFVASLILTGIHAYLGVHVVERGVIFVDLSLAQIAALGATIALLLPISRRRSARAGRLLDQPRVHVPRRVRVLDDPQPARADPAGSDHRHLLRRRVGGGDSGDEQGDLRERAPEGHARRQHPRGVVAGSRQDGAALRRDRPVPLHLPPAVPRDLDGSRNAPRPTASRSRFWDFLFYASFGFVVTSSVSIAGVLLVFCYLIVPSVAAMLYAESIGKRLAIGWSMGTIVSALGVYLSLKLDLPTGATIVCTFGVVLALMAAVRPLFGVVPKGARYAQHEPR